MSSDVDQPLLSCLMPTYNRREFVPLAIHYFQRQLYRNKELIIIDDGTDPVGDLIPDDRRIQYIRLGKKITLGAKLNLGCERALGSIIVHWDDDDWYAPWRLDYQLQGLYKSGTDLCGINELFYFDLCTGFGYRYVYPKDQRTWLSGSTLCYRKALWSGNRFADIDVGMDGLFTWATPRERLSVLEDSRFAVLMIHPHNVSPKKTEGIWWHSYSTDKIQLLLADDWSTYSTNRVSTASIMVQPAIPITSAKPTTTLVAPIRNIFACLVHESPECIVDLVCNLQYIDPSSIILLYNGSKDPRLLDGYPFAQRGAVIHPSPQPMVWGKLHDFALDCMRFALDHFTFDTMTIVDSDQLALRSGYSQYLAEYLALHPGVGMLGNSPMRQLQSTAADPAKAAFAEFELWRPLLQRFPNGEEKFPYWTFWPSTVFTMTAARDLTRFFAEDEQLKQILIRSAIWATEEVILPTLTALLGHKIGANPCSYDYVRYRCPYTSKQIDAALDRHDVFWVHSITRKYDDVLRKKVRERHNNYVKPMEKSITELPSHSKLLLTLPILQRMRPIEGWLEEDEADLLIAATARALTEVPQSQVVVEVGSYCGRATLVLADTAQVVRPSVRIWSIDPHDGKIGSAEQIVTVAPSLEKLKRNLTVAGITDNVEVVQARASDVPWKETIAFLLIDGLHDYLSVAQDFYHFEPWLAAGGYVAFHDYVGYFPGVIAFVDEVVTTKSFVKVLHVNTMIVLKKLSPVIPKDSHSAITDSG